jgi:tRNA (guanine-N7-)-methyltransferase
LKRGVRSYVLRQGRTTPAQQRALDELFATYGIPYRQALLEPRSRPLILEIGSGMGETTAAIAAERPDIDFIAVEVHGPGVGALLRRIEEQGLKNLRVIRHDAVEVLEHMIADGALAGIHLFFPDPWPKKRHHKRRLVQPAFAALAARKLASGGYLHAATDWPEYAAQIDAVLGAEPNFARAVESKARPPTKFEQRGVRLGHEVRDLVFLRR